ncbi:Xin actin-binding repeat-containing protein 2 [Frankliniella fusca]|uniref:Xin actin-binding repeat-containing protein 2 n=1 Tax=Frankliniella fusca TaxID=407009 RepID=A0AAE1HEJ8_9NEOP|nr:Xin actin-binding repeat-containing protein 2 [Frankliniella fusca]
MADNEPPPKRPRGPYKSYVQKDSTSTMPERTARRLNEMEDESDSVGGDEEGEGRVVDEEGEEEDINSQEDQTGSISGDDTGEARVRIEAINSQEGDIYYEEEQNRNVDENQIVQASRADNQREDVDHYEDENHREENFNLLSDPDDSQESEHEEDRAQPENEEPQENQERQPDDHNIQVNQQRMESHPELQKCLLSEEFNQPITTVITASPGEALLNALAVAQANRSTFKSFTDSVKCINSLFPSPVLPKSAFLLDKILYSKTGYTNIFFCTECTQELGIFDNKVHKTVTCPNIDCKTVNHIGDLTKATYLVRYDIVTQLQNLLDDVQIRNKLLEPRDAVKLSPQDLLSDIYDGQCYREFASTIPMDEKVVSFTFCTDGSPLSSSSNLSIWPIFLSVNELPPALRMKNLLLGGLWFGLKKPPMDLFLKPFAEHMQSLSTNGFNLFFNDNAYPMKAYAIACCVDAGARGAVQGLNTHSGYYSCNWCEHPGEFIENAVRFPCMINLPPLRTHARILSDGEKCLNDPTLEYVCGVRGISPLSLLPKFDLCRGLVQDFPHNVPYGIGRVFLLEWKSNCDRGYYIGSPADLDEINTKIMKLTPPIEVRRQPRPITDVKNWKMSECENWIKIYSLAVLEGLMPVKYLNHWSYLVQAVFLLSRRSISHEQVDAASLLLAHFVHGVERLYGKNYMTYNVHILSHLAESVAKWGPVWAVSSYAFESGNGDLKEIIHGQRGIPNQIQRFLSETQALKILRNHFRSPRTEDFIESIEPKPKVQKMRRVGDTVLLGSPSPFFASEEEKYLCTQADVQYGMCEVYKKIIHSNRVYTKINVGRKKNDNSVAILKCGQIISIQNIIFDHGNDKILLLYVNLKCEPYLRFPIQIRSEDHCMRIVTHQSARLRLTEVTEIKCGLKLSSFLVDMQDLEEEAKEKGVKLPSQNDPGTHSRPEVKTETRKASRIKTKSRKQGKKKSNEFVNPNAPLVIKGSPFVAEVQEEEAEESEGVDLSALPPSVARRKGKLSIEDLVAQKRMIESYDKSLCKQTEDTESLKDVPAVKERRSLRMRSDESQDTKVGMDNGSKSKDDPPSSGKFDFRLISKDKSSHSKQDQRHDKKCDRRLSKEKDSFKQERERRSEKKVEHALLPKDIDSKPDALEIGSDDARQDPKQEHTDDRKDKSYHSKRDQRHDKKGDRRLSKEKDSFQQERERRSEKKVEHALLPKDIDSKPDALEIGSDDARQDPKQEHTDDRKDKSFHSKRDQRHDKKGDRRQSKEKDSFQQERERRSEKKVEHALLPKDIDSKPDALEIDSDDARQDPKQEHTDDGKDKSYHSKQDQRHDEKGDKRLSKEKDSFQQERERRSEKKVESQDPKQQHTRRRSKVLQDDTTETECSWSGSEDSNVRFELYITKIKKLEDSNRKLARDLINMKEEMDLKNQKINYLMDKVDLKDRKISDLINKIKMNSTMTNARSPAHMTADSDSDCSFLTSPNKKKKKSSDEVKINLWQSAGSDSLLSSPKRKKSSDGSNKQETALEPAQELAPKIFDALMKKVPLKSNNAGKVDVGNNVWIDTKLFDERLCKTNLEPSVAVRDAMSNIYTTAEMAERSLEGGTPLKGDKSAKKKKMTPAKTEALLGIFRGKSMFKSKDNAYLDLVTKKKGRETIRDKLKEAAKALKKKSVE